MKYLYLIRFFLLSSSILMLGCEEQSEVQHGDSFLIEDFLAVKNKGFAIEVTITGCLRRIFTIEGNDSAGLRLTVCDDESAPGFENSIAVGFANDQDKELVEALLGEKVSIEGVYLEGETIGEYGDSAPYHVLEEAKLVSGSVEH